MDDVRDKTAEERLDYFEQKLAELIKNTDVTQIATIQRTVNADTALIVLLDLKNPEMLKKYGLRRLDEPDKEPPANPLAN